jgi:hypothetical protein
MSVIEPVRRRAMVEVIAIMLTCVDGRPAGGGERKGYEMGVNVWMIVPNWFVYSACVSDAG